MSWKSLRTFVEQHPRRAELVPEHGKARREEGLLHLHEDLTAVRQQGVQELRLLGAIRGERKIGTAHGLEPVRRNVRSHEHRLAELDAGVKHGVPPIGRDVPRVWLFAMPHHHRDLAAEVLLVEAERLLAVPTVVEIDVEFHINRDSTRRVPCTNETSRVAALSNGHWQPPVRPWWRPCRWSCSRPGRASPA